MIILQLTELLVEGLVINKTRILDRTFRDFFDIFSLSSPQLKQNTIIVTRQWIYQLN